MENATWLIIVIAVITALLWYYEHKTVQLELRLNSALDRIEELTDVANDPPFNLQLDDPVLLDAFRLRRPQPAFTRAEIEEWN